MKPGVAETQSALCDGLPLISTGVINCIFALAIPLRCLFGFLGGGGF